MGKSSKDKRDIWYRLAKERGYRARSAFKLIQIDEAYRLFTPDVTRVIDLCAAPGSWSQVILSTFASQGMEDPERPRTLVSVDLQPMAPLAGATMLQADITDPATIPRILDHFSPTTGDGRTLGRADLVVTDGAPDVTGLHDLDTELQHQLLTASLALVRRTLAPGGAFVAKIFVGGEVGLLLAQARTLFRSVSITKPASSRASSAEHFLVCQSYLGEEAVARQFAVDPATTGEPVQVPPGYTRFMETGDLSLYDTVQV